MFGSAKDGILIDNTGIYMLNDWTSEEFSGFMDWEDFRGCADLCKGAMNVVQIRATPKLGINISGCGLSFEETLDLFRMLRESIT